MASVHEHVVTGRVALLDVVQLPLLVDVDEHVALDRLEQPGTLDLARLEDHVAVGQDCGRPQMRRRSITASDPGNRRSANGVVQQEEGDLEEVGVARVLGPVTLEGAEVVCVA
jgi:hypothetical protein